MTFEHSGLASGGISTGRAGNAAMVASSRHHSRPTESRRQQRCHQRPAQVWMGWHGSVLHNSSGCSFRAQAWHASPAQLSEECRRSSSTRLQNQAPSFCNARWRMYLMHQYSGSRSQSVSDFVSTSRHSSTRPVRKCATSFLGSMLRSCGTSVALSIS